MDTIVYVATINVPGYLPESDPFYSHSPAECWAYLRDERERGEDDTEGDEYSDTYYTLKAKARTCANVPDWSGALDTVYGGSPGSDSPHDLGLAYTVDVTSDVRWDDDSDEWVSTVDEPDESERYDGENMCPGHPDGPVMGETFYCDGTCI